MKTFEGLEKLTHDNIKIVFQILLISIKQGRFQTRYIDDENIDNERISKFVPEIFFIVKAHYVTIVN